MLESGIYSSITDFLKSRNDWVFGGEIEDYIREAYGPKASNASRRCRELFQAGKLERQLVKVEGVRNKVVQYRYREPVVIEEFAPRRSAQQVLV